MKAIILLHLVMWVIGHFSYAQTVSLIKNDSVGNGIFRYQEFKKGKVIFKNGSISEGILNYNILLEEMQFIDKNDTLSLSEPNTIHSVIIGTDTFFYDKKFMEQVFKFNNLKLAVVQSFKISNKQKTGAYGISSSTSAITSYNSLAMLNQRNQQLLLREDVFMSPDRSYYIGNKFNQFTLLSKKNVLRYLPSVHEEQIELFLANNKIDINKEADAIKLVTFLGSLEN